MQKQTFKTVFGTLWLPLYLFLGVTWLLAPGLAHEHYGTLQLISNEEAAKRAAALWFRAGDIAAAFVLIMAALYFRIGHHSRWFGKCIVAVAVLSAIDGLFPDTCYIGHEVCSTAALSISAVHDGETLLLITLIALLSITDALRHRRGVSLGFVAVQSVVALLLASGLASQQFIVVLQNVYEVAVVIWLGWLVDRYNPVSPTAGHERLARRAIGVWVAAGGVFALVAALPHIHIVQEITYRGHSPAGLLLEQHGIITGVLFLYIARHLWRGERPALWLATVLFYLQIIKYSLLTPQPVAVVMYGVLLALLIYARNGFDRNVEPPSWFSRLADVGIVASGAVASVLIGLVFITLSGQQAHFQRDVRSIYGAPYHSLNRRKEKVSERNEARLKVFAETLGVSVGVVALWSLFRPKRPEKTVLHFNRAAFKRLLKHYSTSSEDYFKLWPADKTYFFAPGSEGAIAYRVEGGVAYMLADPVAPNRQAQARILEAFSEYVRRHGWVLCVLVIGSKQIDIYERLGLGVRQIGSSAVIDVATFNTETVTSKWWRWQQNRAVRQGWTYERLSQPHAPHTMHMLRSVSNAWLAKQGRREQGFALGYYDEGYLQQCVLHVLRDNTGQIIAFANELPVFGQVRQASVDLIRHLPEAAGAMPVLLKEIIANLKDTKFQTFDLGFVPMARLDNDLARLMRRLASGRFSSAGLEQFKNKFEPEWHPDYIAYTGDLIDLAKIAASLERLLKAG